MSEWIKRDKPLFEVKKDELKPCPFCGSNNLTHDVRGGRGAFGFWECAYLYVACRDCHIQFDVFVRITKEEDDTLPDEKILQLTLERGVEKWNTRYERTCEMQKSKGSLWGIATCSKCGNLTIEGDRNYCPNCGAKVVRE